MCHWARQSVLSGRLSGGRNKTKACYCTFGCIPMTTCWGPSLATCRGCASPSRRGLSTPWAAPCKILCLVCSSHEVRKWDALAASLCTASLNFFIVKSALFRGWSFTITMPEMGGEQQLLCILQVLDLNYSLCPWISTLAITPGGLWKHCST